MQSVMRKEKSEIRTNADANGVQEDRKTCFAHYGKTKR